jgi:hypothetical protein
MAIERYNVREAEARWQEVWDARGASLESIRLSLDWSREVTTCAPA